MIYYLDSETLCWCHDMEILSTFLAIWDGDQPVTMDSLYNGLAFIFLLAWANPWQAFG